MKTETKAQGSVQDEVRRLMELVRVLARTLGFNNSALARQGNIPLASLVRYFKGEGEPKIEFLLAAVRTMGLDIREFFELAYPAPKSPSAARQRIDRILGPIRPGAMMEPPPPPEEEKPEGAPLQREDIERMMDQLRQDVREILAERETKAEPAKPERPRPKKKTGGR